MTIVPLIWHSRKKGIYLFWPLDVSICSFCWCFYESRLLLCHGAHLTPSFFLCDSSIVIELYESLLSNHQEWFVNMVLSFQWSFIVWSQSYFVFDGAFRVPRSRKSLPSWPHQWYDELMRDLSTIFDAFWLLVAIPLLSLLSAAKLLWIPSMQCHKASFTSPSCRGRCSFFGFSSLERRRYGVTPGFQRPSCPTSSSTRSLLPLPCHRRVPVCCVLIVLSRKYLTQAALSPCPFSLLPNSVVSQRLAPFLRYFLLVFHTNRFWLFFSV